MFVSDYKMKLNADPREICSFFKGQQCLTVKMLLKVFLTCVCSDEPSFFLFFYYNSHKSSTKSFLRKFLIGVNAALDQFNFYFLC